MRDFKYKIGDKVIVNDVFRRKFTRGNTFDTNGVHIITELIDDYQSRPAYKTNKSETWDVFEDELDIATKLHKVLS